MTKTPSEEVTPPARVESGEQETFTSTEVDAFPAANER
jgi:hypothetical protein